MPADIDNLGTFCDLMFRSHGTAQEHVQLLRVAIAMRDGDGIKHCLARLSACMSLIADLTFDFNTELQKGIPEAVKA